MEIPQRQNPFSKKKNFCKSAQFFYGTVAIWCQQFGLTEEEKRRFSLSEDKEVLTSVPPEEVQLWSLLRQWHLETGCEKQIWASKHCPAESSSHSYVNKLTFNIVFQTGWSIKLVLTRTTGWEALFLSAGNTYFLELILNHESMQQFLGE